MEAWEAHMGRAISETDEERVRQGDIGNRKLLIAVRKKETYTMRCKIFDSRVPTRDGSDNYLLWTKFI